MTETPISSKAEDETLSGLPNGRQVLTQSATRKWWWQYWRPAPTRRIWVQHVAVDALVLQTRVAAARSRGLQPWQEKVAAGICSHIDRALDAAFRRDPIPSRFGNWRRGTLVEAAYRNLHAARTQIIDLYDHDDLHAEIPVAVARARSTLHREDPRQVSVEALEAEPCARLRARLRRLINDSYDSIDAQHVQLRSFRNILLMSALLITILIAITAIFVAQRPTVMPLCFPNEMITDASPAGVVTTTVDGQNCPTRSETGSGPSGGDILIVALLGLLGGALGATASIRNLKGTNSAYDVPVALALLKVPLGGFTAVLAVVAIQGAFVPGLTVLDSQEQILAYALVFGFGQQAFTRLLDQRAQTLLEGLPAKDATTEPPRPPMRPEPPDAHVTGRPVQDVDTPPQAAAATNPSQLPNPQGEARDPV